MVDQVNAAGQPGIVTRTPGKLGRTTYRVRPRPGHSWVVELQTGIAPGELRVTLGPAGTVEEVVMMSHDRNGTTTDTRRIVAGPVSAAAPERPSVEYSVIAPYLP